MDQERSNKDFNDYQNIYWIWSLSKSNDINMCYWTYNVLLSTYWLLDHTEINALLDNESIYEISQKMVRY